MSCNKCEALPPPLPEYCELYFSAPEAATEAVLRKALGEAGLAISEPHADILCVESPRDALSALCSGPLTRLNALQMDDTRCLVVEAGVEPGLRELMRMESLSVLVARLDATDLTALLAADRLTNHFQPIVHCKEPSRVFGYECLARGVAEDGSTVFPDVLFSQARKAGLMFQLDRAARLAAIRNAAKFGIRERVFINFNPTAIYDPEFCLRTTVAAMKDSGLSADQIVFEVVESDEMHDVDHLIRIVSYYRERGFSAALDDLGAGYSSLNLLHRLKPDIIKLDMALIRDVDSDPFKGSLVANLLELAQSLGVKSVVEGVETEGEWQWLRDHGADYAQGYLFGRPAAEPTAPVAPARL